MGLFLSFLLLLSGFLRVGGITRTPPELFGDEVDVGYQAYSLLKTGRDLYNQPLPTYIHSLSEWRAPLLMYATVPTIAIFGNTDWGVRLPEIILGTLAPLILFLLVYQITRSKYISFFSALFLSVMPWHIYYSRAAFEVVLMLNLIMLGTLLFFRRRFAISYLLFALSMYTYSTAVVFIPLWILALVLITKKRPSFLSLFILLLIVAPLVYQVVAGPARGRFSTLSIFNDSSTIKTINDLRNSDPKLGIIWHNKLEAYFNIIIANYLRAFSTDFLFVRGDPIYRHSIQIIGQLFPVTAPLLLIGICYLVNRRQWLWLSWLALAPLPAVLTSDGGYHATRLFLMIPPLAVAMGVGFSLIRRKRFLAYLYLLLFAFQFIWTAHYYIVHYPVSSWRWWDVGYKGAMLKLNELSPNYSRVFINNTYEPSLIRFLFWTGYSPEKFHQQFTIDQPQKNIVPNYDGFSLDDKYFFGSFSKSVTLLPNSLYLISQRDDVGGDWDWRKSPPDGVKVLYASTNPDGFPILYLITKK